MAEGKKYIFFLLPPARTALCLSSVIYERKTQSILKKSRE
jgi:hypothetical protein